ncbi:ParA family protein [Arenicella sp. 4NH20-0111]|uniref:ParA family protein n=1 Tax=Arenicella sp. 4NH20-0111 TaxID=3127648 RepID=UPI00333EB2D5
MNKIAFISQSGNVMKSSIACAMAVECANNGLDVAVADLDKEHRTISQWLKTRIENEIDPTFHVYCVDSAKDALNCFSDESLAIIDAPSRATSATALIAKNVDLIVLPTPPSKKDIDLSLGTLYQLINDGVPMNRLVLVLTRVGTAAELNQALDYIGMANFGDTSPHVLSSAIWERVGYRGAINDSYSITETSFQTLNDSAKAVIHQLLSKLLR